MLDDNLVGVWSVDVRYDPGAPSDECLIFKADGAGRVEIFNWSLCSADLFHWSVAEPGTLRLVGKHLLQVSEDARSVEEKASQLGDREFRYTITEEDTPRHIRMRILRLQPEFLNSHCFGFAGVNSSILEEPRFSLRK